jgi:hypothetical protein
MDVRPFDMAARMWAKTAGLVMAESGRLTVDFAAGRLSAGSALLDMGRWSSAWWGSIAEDPAWHARWMGDVTRAWLRLPRTVRMRDPRMRGPAELRLGRTASR